MSRDIRYIDMLPGMNGESMETELPDLRTLCERAAAEQDTYKLTELVREINDLLEKRRASLKMGIE
jgi:hypothetical protein